MEITPPPPGKDATADNHTRLLDAALRVFSEKGYHETDIVDVISESGLSADELTDAFKDKEDLYFQACCHALELWQGAYSDNVSADMDPVSKLKLLSSTSFLYPVDHPEVRRLLEDGPLMVLYLSERYAEITQRGKLLLKAILEEGFEAGVFRQMDCGAVADLLFDLYKYYTMSFYIESSTIEPEKFVSLLEDLVINGLLRR
jgi:AcrR family transcriptional regulator